MNMTDVLKVLMAGVLIAVMLAGQAAAKTHLTWLQTDFPPWFILSGPAQGMGCADVITRKLEEHLQGYTFESRVANMPRIYRQLKQGRDV